MTADTAQAINTIASSFTAIGIIFVAFQAYYAKEQLKEQKEQTEKLNEQLTTSLIQMENDHERSRRQTSIELMLNWIEGLDIKTASARKLVESLDDKTCEKIYRMEKLTISKDYLTLLQGILDDDKLDQSNDFITITDYQSSIIRSYVLNYLNSLETILTGWRLHVVDKEIVEEEFIYLYDSEMDKCVLHNFRNVAGVHSYPSIKAFCSALNEKFSKEKIVTKEKVA